MSEVKEYTLDDVIKEMKKHNRKIDTKLISRAYDLAKSQHEGQLRKSGEPYIITLSSCIYISNTWIRRQYNLCCTSSWCCGGHKYY